MRRRGDDTVGRVAAGRSVLCCWLNAKVSFHTRRRLPRCEVVALPRTPVSRTLLVYALCRPSVASSRLEQGATLVGTLLGKVQCVQLINVLRSYNCKVVPWFIYSFTCTCTCTCFYNGRYTRALYSCSVLSVRKERRSTRVSSRRAKPSAYISYMYMHMYLEKCFPVKRLSSRCSSSAGSCALLSALATWSAR